MSSATTSPTSLNVPKPAIVAASTVSDVVNVMANDPQVRGAILSAFSSQIDAAKKNPVAIVAGLVIGPLAAHYGLQIDAGTSTAIGIGLAILAGDVSQWWAQRKKAAP